MKTRVLIVDDSAVVRKLLSTYLQRYDDVEVIDTATDPYDARDKIVKLKPDVITLDIEMPKMDGISFLKKLVAHYPIPTIMVSSLTKDGSSATLQALEIGAVDFVGKPSAGSLGDADAFVKDLHQKVIAASSINIKRFLERSKTNRSAVAKPVNPLPVSLGGNKIIAIGSSTGGTEALKKVFELMPQNSPGVVVVQHMPEVFTKYFAERLDKISALQVSEATDGAIVKPGTALIAPGNFQMEITKNGPSYQARVFQGERVNRHRPSVEVLFNSVAKHAGANAVGVIMTGMGGDGAQGLLNMKNAGANTIAQDEASCVVFGMPKEAIKVGAANKVVSLLDIPKTIFSF